MQDFKFPRMFPQTRTKWSNLEGVGSEFNNLTETYMNICPDQTLGLSTQQCNFSKQMLLKKPWAWSEGIISFLPLLYYSSDTEGMKWHKTV